MLGRKWRERKEEKTLVAHSKEHHLWPGTKRQCGILFVLLATSPLTFSASGVWMLVLEDELCDSSLRTTSHPEKAQETEPRTTGS